MTAARTWANGDWSQTFTGRAFVPAAPTPDMFCLDDVAHGLSHMCRYAGHTSRFYSVAEHAVLVSQVLEDRYPDNPLLWAYGLHHDDSEAYLADVTRPVKPLLSGYYELEERIMAAIAIAFQLPIGFHKVPEVIEADRAIIVDEAHELMIEPECGFGFTWEGGGQIVVGLTPTMARKAFTERHHELVAKVRGHFQQLYSV